MKKKSSTPLYINFFCLASLMLLMLTIGQIAEGQYGYDEVKVPNEKSKLAFLEIRRLAEQGRLISVEDVLAWYQEHDPEVLSRFSLMRHSRSLQGASPENPRAIVYGLDARVIFSFNGAPDQTGFHEMEWIVFDDQQKRFEFFELNFDPEQKKPAQFSKTNPGKCMRCHSSHHPRPIWEAYDFWPGAYGEDDDALVPFDELRYPVSKELESKRDQHLLHRREFLSFRSQVSEHSRYRYLHFVESQESDVAPYTRSRRSGKAPLRPNLNFNKALTPLQGQALMRKMQELPTCYRQVAPVYVALQLACELYEDAEESGNYWSQMREGLRRKLPEETAPWSRFKGNEQLQDMGRLLQLLDIEHDEYHLGLRPIHWSYFVGVRHLSSYVVESIFYDHLQIDYQLPDYRNLLEQMFPFYYENYGLVRNVFSGQTPIQYSCQRLRQSIEVDFETMQQSCQQELRESVLTKVKDHQSGAQDLALFEMCASCHSSAPESKAPRIFDQRGAFLSPRIARDSLRRASLGQEQQGHMPPDRNLSAAELRILQKWVESSH